MMVYSVAVERINLPSYGLEWNFFLQVAIMFSIKWYTQKNMAGGQSVSQSAMSSQPSSGMDSQELQRRKRSDVKVIGIMRKL